MADTIESTIKSQIANINNYLDSFIDTTTDLSRSLENLVDDIDINYKIDYATIGRRDDLVPAEVDGKPGAWDASLGELNTFLTNGLADPVLESLRPVPGIVVPAFPVQPDSPTISLPTAPSPGIGDVPEAPTLNYPTIPDAPDFVLPSVPTFSSITLPDVPNFSTPPTFSGVKPVDLERAAIPVYSYTEQEYISSLEDAARAWLENIIQNGGTGLGAAVEDAIWSRAMTRETTTRRQNIESTLDEFAASGFPRPSGSLRARLEEIRAELQIKTEDLSRNILEEQARLAQNNTQFALTTAITHEATRLQHHNAIQQRAFEYASTLVQMAIAIYDLKVKEYMARWDGYKAEATVFGELVKASLIEVERYKAEVEASLAVVEIDKNKVELYKAQIDSVDTLAKFYVTQMEAARIQASIEELKFRSFSAQIEAFGAELDSKRLEFDGYKTRMDGELSKVRIYDAQVNAYRSMNEGVKSNIDAQAANVDSSIKVNENKLRKLIAETDIYKTKLAARSEVVKSAVSAFLAENDAYKSSIEKAKVINEVNKTNRELDIEISQANVLQLNETYRRQGELIMKNIEVSQANIVAGIGHFSKVSAAIASQVSTIAQLVSSEDRSAV